MRHTIVYSFLLLFTAGCFTACKDGDAIFSDINHPESDFFKGESNARLALSVGHYLVGTRSTYNEVQGNENFQGISQLWLIPFSVNSYVEPISSSDSRLGNALAVGGISALYDNNQSYLYDWMPIPNGTASYLAYALSKGQTTGDMTIDVTGTKPSDFTFTPAGFPLDDTKGQALADYLTAIANATGWSSAGLPLNTMREKFLQMRAGSSANVLAEVQLLYDRVKGGTDAVSTAIRAAILSSGVGVSGDVVNFPDALKGYPAEVGLPDGAASIKWVDNQFAVTDDLLYSTLNVAKTDAYVKPAPLFYRTNSCIATDETGDMRQYYNGASAKANWDWNHSDDATKGNSVLGQYDTYCGRVFSTTKSVAIINPLQYCVARIDLKLISETSTLLDYDENTITLNSNTFPITGLLVSGQYQVGWDFKPIGDDEYIVYDNVMKSQSGGTVHLVQANDFDSATAVHSLVYESKAVTSADDVLNVAIELQNNSGEPFTGLDGTIIPAGCKFYLVAQLKPNIQPDQKAFQQDYITEINLKVPSLKAAYNVIPDLRKQDIEVGLTVEDWILSTPSLLEL